MSYECSDEDIILRTFISYRLVHIHQKKKIAPEIAANIAIDDSPYYVFVVLCIVVVVVSLIFKMAYFLS